MKKTLSLLALIVASVALGGEPIIEPNPIIEPKPFSLPYVEVNDTFNLMNVSKVRGEKVYSSNGDLINAVIVTAVYSNGCVAANSGVPAKRVYSGRNDGSGYLLTIDLIQYRNAFLSSILCTMEYNPVTADYKVAETIEDKVIVNGVKYYIGDLELHNH